MNDFEKKEMKRKVKKSRYKIGMLNVYTMPRKKERKKKLLTHGQMLGCELYLRCFVQFSNRILFSELKTHILDVWLFTFSNVQEISHFGSPQLDTSLVNWNQVFHTDHQNRLSVYLSVLLYFINEIIHALYFVWLSMLGFFKVKNLEENCL